MAFHHRLRLMQRSWLVMGAVMLSTACSPKLSVPDDAQIQCTTTSECPADFSCLVSIQRCVRKDGDLALPYIVGASVDPPIATRGSTVKVTLTAYAELAAPPKVTLNWIWNDASSGSAPAQFVSHDGVVYVFAYTVGSAEPEGNLSLHADIVSPADVPNTYDQSNVLQLDFEPPEIVSTYAVQFTAPTDLQRLAPTGSVRAVVDAATTGTVVTAQFLVNEPLRDGVVVTTSTPETVAFTCDPPQGTFYKCTAVTNGLATQGVYTIVANVSDLAGNTAMLSVGTFTFDSTPPPVPSVMTAGSIVLHRTPHGTTGSPQLSLTGASGAVEPGAAVYVWDGPDSTKSEGYIFSGFANPDGSFDFTLPGVDRKEVYVQAIDAAGNPSIDATTKLATLVLDGVWTATLGGKTANSSFGNPNRLREQPFLFGARDYASNEPADPALLAVDTDKRLLTTSGGPAFVPGPSAANTTHPSARAAAGIAYDCNADRHVLFGGYWDLHGGAHPASDDTWIFDGFNWVQQFPGVAPSPRAGHAMVFDKARGNTVVFGGCSGAAIGTDGGCASPLGDTWTWNGSTWMRACWQGCTYGECECAAPNITPTPMPSPRSAMAAFWDDVRAEVVIVGGFNGTSTTNDMWGWNGVSWEHITPTPATLPDSMQGALTASDSANGITMMTGGNKTWIWKNGGWTSFPTAGPTILLWYDEAAKAFMGTSGGGTSLYTWNGTDWAGPDSLTINGTALQGQVFSSSYNTARNELLIFGGCYSLNAGCTPPQAGGGAFDNTWLYRDRTVSERIIDNPSPVPTNDWRQPHARAYAGIAALPSKTVAYLVRGKSLDNRPSFIDTWSWNGVTWAAVDSANDPTDSPVAYLVPAMSQVSESVIVRVGGYCSYEEIPGVTTAYTSDGLTWENATSGPVISLPPNSTSYPAASVLHGAMTYRPGVGGIYFGGGATWVASASGGVLWTKQTPPASPSSKNMHGFAYCPNAGGALLFGGNDGTKYLNETWLLNGSVWQKRTPATSPSARGQVAMFCDNGRGNVFMVGGTDGTKRFDEVWEWDGTDWHDRTPALLRPLPREGASATFLPWINQGVFFGGQDNSQVFDDTWIWDGGSTSAPAHVFWAQFAEADAWDTIQTKFSAEYKVQLTQVEATWVSGGTGYATGGAQNGADILLWDHGRWRDTGVTNSATADAPAQLTWSTAIDSEWASYDPATRDIRLRRLFAGQERGLTVAVTPRGTNRDNPTPAVIASDYVEVSVHYRLTSQ